MNPQPDLQALALAHAIRQQESGGNYSASGDAGTSTGAYQFQPNTWKLFSKQILGNDSAPMTPENQNAVAYGMIKTWKDQGMGPAQIAAKWNSGSENGWENKVGTTQINGQSIPYNVPRYVQGVVSNFKQIYPTLAQKYGQPQQDQTNTPQQPSVGGFVGNALSSVGNLAKGIGTAIMHPVQTAENLAGTVAGGVENTINHPENLLTLGLPILQRQGNGTGVFDQNNPDLQKFNTMVGYFKNRYGGDSLSQIVHNIGNTAYTDPAGMALDLSTLLDGVGGALGAVSKISKVSELGDAANAIRSVSDTINPINAGVKALKPIAKLAGGVANSALEHTTGMGLGTMGTIIENPESFSSVAKASINRPGILEEVQNGLSRLESEYEDTGAQYNNIRNSSSLVKLPNTFIEDILKKGTAAEEDGGKAIKFGLKLDDAGNVTADTKSFTRSSADLNPIQQFINNWKGKTELTPQEFLNMRTDSAKLGKIGREIGENKGAALFGRSVRAQLNKVGRPQIGDLEGVDKLASEQLPLIQKVRKDIFNNDGSVKDAAVSKMANALNKPELLNRLESVSPGISQKLKVLKAVEDIEKSSGIKVGTYARGGLEAFSIAHGNIPLIVGLIISHPQVAAQILRGFGYVGKAAAPILARVRLLIGAIPGKGLIGKAALVNNQAVNPAK